MGITTRRERSKANQTRKGGRYVEERRGGLQRNRPEPVPGSGYDFVHTSWRRESRDGRALRLNLSLRQLSRHGCFRTQAWSFASHPFGWFALSRMNVVRRAVLTETFYFKTVMELHRLHIFHAFGPFCTEYRAGECLMTAQFLAATRRCSGKLDG